MAGIQILPLTKIDHYAEAALISRMTFDDQRRLKSCEIKAYLESSEATNGLGAWLTDASRGIFQPKMIGFILFQFRGELVNLHNFAVDPCFRRLKAFRKMTEKLANASVGKRIAIMTTVRETDVEACCALRQLGFEMQYSYSPEPTNTKPADRVEVDRYTFEFVLPKPSEVAR